MPAWVAVALWSVLGVVVCIVIVVLLGVLIVAVRSTVEEAKNLRAAVKAPSMVDQVAAARRRRV